MGRPQRAFIFTDEGVRQTDVIRFAVTQPDGAVVSGIWSVWAGKNNRDFYATATGLRSHIKLSIHPTVVQIGLTSQGQADLVAKGTGSANRHWLRVSIPPLETGQFRQLAVVSFPFRYLRLAAKQPDRDFIPLPPGQDGVCARVIFVIYEGTERVISYRAPATLIGHLFDGVSRHLCLFAVYQSIDEQQLYDVIQRMFQLAPTKGELLAQPSPDDDLSSVMVGGEDGGLIEITEVHNIRYSPHEKAASIITADT